MIVLPGAGTPNRSEQACVDALRGVPGVCVPTLLLPGDRSAEVDILVATADGLATIEAKGTSLSGDLRPHANGSWTIGGRIADFPSGPNPTVQARRQAQVSAKLLRDAKATVPPIPAIVVVAGRTETSVTMPETIYVKVTADVVVTTPRHLPATVQHVLAEAANEHRRRHGGLTAPLDGPAVRSALVTLGVPPNAVPTVEQLASEGIAPSHYESEKAERARRDILARQKRRADRRRKARPWLIAGGLALAAYAALAIYVLLS